MVPNDIRLFPGAFNMRHPAWDIHEVNRTASEDRVGDVDAVTFRVADFWRHVTLSRASDTRPRATSSRTAMNACTSRGAGSGPMRGRSAGDGGSAGVRCQSIAPAIGWAAGAAEPLTPWSSSGPWRRQ